MRPPSSIRPESAVDPDDAVSAGDAESPLPNPPPKGEGGDGELTRCAVCLEAIPALSELCPECGEPPVASSAHPASQPWSEPQQSWLGQHWRPIVTIGLLSGLIGTGVALRYLAPDRYAPPGQLSPPPAAAPACDVACWHGEACQMGRCVYSGDNDTLAQLPLQPNVAGPFPLPADVVDALPLDAERYAVSSLLGVHVHNARSGGTLSLVSDAPHAQRLVRVGDVVYATAPQRIYVIDAGDVRVLKTIELGSLIGDVAVGASGRRVLVSLPGARAVAVVATDYHAEVSRFHFGDDQPRAVAIDDAGERALASNGVVPLAGLAAPASASRYGVLYAFDPSRLPSEQGQVRTAMMGNPAALLLAPDGHSGWVALREKNALVPLEGGTPGSVQRLDPLKSCNEPEQLVLVRRGRRALLRCGGENALQLIDLERGEIARKVELNGRVSDLAVSPDGKQAIVVLPRDGSGAIGLIDLDSFELTLTELAAEPHRVRFAPDGKSALVLSDRSKVAWVLR